MIWPKDLRGTFFFFIAWALGVISLIALLALPDQSQGFIALYCIAWIVFMAGNMFTAGYGLAYLAQSRYDERKLRKQIERELIG